MDFWCIYIPLPLFSQAQKSHSHSCERLPCVSQTAVCQNPKLGFPIQNPKLGIPIHVWPEQQWHCSPGVSGNSRSRPFPGIPASHSRSRKLGMIFSFPFPFPKVGNAIFHSRSRSQNLGMQFSIPVPVTGNGLSKSGIRTGIEFKRWEKEGF